MRRGALSGGWQCWMDSGQRDIVFHSYQLAGHSRKRLRNTLKLEQQHI